MKLDKPPYLKEFFFKIEKAERNLAHRAVLALSSHSCV